MTGRERLLAALRGEVPDRVPVCFPGLPAFDAEHWVNREPSYARLMTAVREGADAIRPWRPKWILDGGVGYFLTATREASLEVEKSKEGEYERRVLTIRTPKGKLVKRTRTRPDVHTAWTDEHFVKTTEDIERVLSIPYEPAGLDASGFAAAAEEVGDAGLVQVATGDPLLYVAELFEFGEFTIYALTERETVKRLLDAFHARIMDRLRTLLDAGVGAASSGVASVWRIVGPEYATPPYLPPELFGEYVVPYVREMVEIIHSYGGYARIHCHGKVSKVLDHFLATNADAVDPVEPPPQGDVELAEAKRRLGGRMTIFGNVEFSFLETASPEEIRAEVGRIMDAAKAGGRFVVMPTAEPINVPLEGKTEENHRALIDAVHELGVY